MNEPEIYNVAADFSPNPIARYAKQSRFSGEVFREKVLEPRLKRNERFTLDFSGTSGAGSSFLEEAFAGLIRKGYKKEDIINNINILWPPSSKSYDAELRFYLENAENAK